MDDIRVLNLKLNSLAVFRNLLSLPVISELEKLTSVIEDPVESVKLYTKFISVLYHNCDNFSEFLYKSVLEDDNFYIRAVARGEEVDRVIKTAVRNELILIQEISLLSSRELKSHIKYDGYLPDWNTAECDFVSSYEERLKSIAEIGIGMFSRHNVFKLSGEEIVPVKYPDNISLSDFECYGREREPIIKNTKALLEKGEASNVLLYGEAGTGKSSTVKAIANHFKDKGLRLVEVKKKQLHRLPAVFEQLAGNPLKFIVFIDDLSFNESDDDFTALKACLEGNVSAGAGNVVIYATSNRRHLVRERYSDREGDELHVGDSLQEAIGLSARFGLTVTFEKPGKDDYLQIVRHFAKECGIEPDKQLMAGAEAYAIRNNGRSPRTARQFIELQKSEVY